MARRQWLSQRLNPPSGGDTHLPCPIAFGTDDLPHRWLFNDFEHQRTVGRMTAHGDEDDPVRGEVALMQREGRRSRPGRIRPRRFLLHQTANTLDLSHAASFLVKRAVVFGLPSV